MNKSKNGSITRGLGIAGLTCCFVASMLGQNLLSVAGTVKSAQNDKAQSSAVVSSANDGIKNVSSVYGDASKTAEFLNEGLKAEKAEEAPEYRTLIVSMKSKSLLDTWLDDSSLRRAYPEFSDYAASDRAAAYIEVLNAEQKSFLSSLKVSYRLNYAYTSAINGVSITVGGGDSDKIAKVKGVSSVMYSETYYEPEVEATYNEVNVYSTGIYDSSDLNYKGDGMIVAILDTGFDYTHPAFREMPTGGIAKTRSRRCKTCRRRGACRRRNDARAYGKRFVRKRESSVCLRLRRRRYGRLSHFVFARHARCGYYCRKTGRSGGRGRQTV